MEHPWNIVERSSTISRELGATTSRGQRRIARRRGLRLRHGQVSEGCEPPKPPKPKKPPKKARKAATTCVVCARNIFAGRGRAVGAGGGGARRDGARGAARGGGDAVGALVVEAASGAPGRRGRRAIRPEGAGLRHVAPEGVARDRRRRRAAWPHRRGRRCAAPARDARAARRDGRAAARVVHRRVARLVLLAPRNGRRVRAAARPRARPRRGALHTRLHGEQGRHRAACRSCRLFATRSTARWRNSAPCATAIAGVAYPRWRRPAGSRLWGHGLLQDWRFSSAISDDARGCCAITTPSPATTRGRVGRGRDRRRRRRIRWRIRRA